MAATKTRAVLYTLAETAINLLVNGSAFAVPAGAVLAEVHLYFAQVTVTAPAAGTNIKIQGHLETSGNENLWMDLAVIPTGITAAANTTANGAISANATSITTAGSATFGARTKLLYFRDSATAGEWIEMTTHVTTTITIPSPGIVLAHLTGINIYDQGIRQNVTLDVQGIQRLRVVVDNNTQATGPTVAVFADVCTEIP